LAFFNRVATGIDLGTANTVVCRPRGGVVLNEPSVMVISKDDGKRPRLIAFGRDARALVGHTPQGSVTARPVQDGVIIDLELAKIFITALMEKMSMQTWKRFRAKAVIGIPVGATSLERRALLEVAEEAHISRATLIPEPIAAAVACGLDPLGPTTHMVVDVGGGTAEVTAFCYGGIVANRSCRVAGDEMTLALYQHLRSEHQILIGETTAEDLKIRAASEEGPSLVVEGRDAGSGRPRLITISVDEIVEATRPITTEIVQTLAGCLDDLGAQGVRDIMGEGVYLVGGGSLMRGFDKLVEKTFGFPVRRAERPLTCVAEGTAMCLTKPDVLRAYGIS
jgi:rod shape-determining protein MreB and related proteins